MFIIPLMELLSFIVFIILSISIFALLSFFPLSSSSSSVNLLLFSPLGFLLEVTHIDFLCFYMWCSVFFVLTNLRLGFVVFGLAVE